MSLITDRAFVNALRSNSTLMALLPVGDVYNTTITTPDIDLDNAPVPYIIVSFDGMQNDDTTKDSSCEGDTDNVQISVEVCAKTRPQLGKLAIKVRNTIKSFFENAQPNDDDAGLIPIEYTLTTGGVNYDPDKPCYWMTLQYQCDTNIDNDEEEE